MKLYTGMWVAYKKTPGEVESKYSSKFFSARSDNEAVGILIGDALAMCPKSDGWENHSYNYSEVPIDALELAVELAKEND